MSDPRGNSTGPDQDGPSRWPVVRLTLLIVGCVLVAAATAIALLTDDARWLKAAVLGAGWACAFALIAEARPRTDPAWTQERVQELRRSYELEVQREVAARREYELQLEVQLRRELDVEMAARVTELRGEIGTLRHELQSRSEPPVGMRRVHMHSETVHAEAVHAESVHTDSVHGDAVQGDAVHGESVHPALGAADTVVGMAPISIAPPLRENRSPDLLAQHGGASWDRGDAYRGGTPGEDPSVEGPAVEEPALDLPVADSGATGPGAAGPGAGFGGTGSGRTETDDPDQLPLFRRDEDREPPHPVERESPSGRHAVPVDTGSQPAAMTTGARRRRRYREDHEENEVLNRVLREGRS